MGKAEQIFEEQREAAMMSPHAEASKMLEAALQQMDGIISGKWTYLWCFVFAEKKEIHYVILWSSSVFVQECRHANSTLNNVYKLPTKCKWSV